MRRRSTLLLMPRRLAAEFAGTAFLVAIVVGSGITGDRSSDSTGLALLINAFATGTGLVALILAFGPASGAHFNPAVSLGEGILGTMRWAEAGLYALAQVGGGVVGVIAAEVMFGAPVLSISRTDRLAPGVLFAEGIATTGLLIVILGCVRGRRPATTIAFAVGGYIAAGYFFTSSTSFANPAVTIARAFTDTFAGIAPSAAATFVPIQLASAAIAVLFMRWLYPTLATLEGHIVVPEFEPLEAAT